MLNRLLSILLLAGTVGSLAACNTVDGMGRDLERAGEATSETARDVGKRM